MIDDFVPTDFDFLVTLLILPGSFLLIYYGFKFGFSNDSEAIGDLKYARFNRLKGKVPYLTILLLQLSLCATCVLLARFALHTAWLRLLPYFPSLFSGS